MNQMEMLEAARREYHEDQLQPTALEILQPGNAFLQDLVDGFLKKMRAQTNKTGIACFFEQNPSNVGGIVGKQERIVSFETNFLTPKANYCHRGLSSAKTPAV